MRRLVSAVTVGLLLLLISASVLALGMGRVRTSSSLGDPLDFTVNLLSQPGDGLAAECIQADVFSGDSRIPPEMVRISINRAGDGSPSSLRVVTSSRIDEPLARVDLSLQCGTSIKRSYVVFIDPPVLNLAQSSNFAAAADDLTPAPRRIVREPAAASPPRRSSRRTQARSSREPSAARSSRNTGVSSGATRQQRTAAARAARNARKPVSVSTQPAAPGSSLKLESTPTLQAATAATGAAAKPSPARQATNSALAAASAALGTEASRAVGAAPTASDTVLAAATSASAAVSGLLGELAAKAEADAQLISAEKLQALDRDLARLRSDNEALQRSAVELQERLREAEQDGSSNILIYGLLLALLLLVLALAALLVRQSAMRREAEWVKAAGVAEEPPLSESSAGQVRSIVRPSSASGSSTGAEAAAAAAARLAEAATKPGPRSLLHAGAAKSPPTEPMDPVLGAAASAAAVGAVGSRSDSNSEGPHERTAIHDSGKEVGVDELIDLEQQADFFEVLGQDDAAIDLLMGQLQGPGGSSPLPYLKLLEIHRRRGERAAYDRIRDRFNHRFTAFAPDWEAHSGHDRVLQDYPEVIQQLQRAWTRPASSMNTLTDLLFKRHESGEAFDLPAYGELLFLYSIARDLAETESAADGVDLLLPLDATPEFGSSDPVAGSPVSEPDTLTVPRRDGGPGFLADLPFLETDSTPGAASPAQPRADDGDKENSDDKDNDRSLPDLDLRDEPAEPKGPLSN